MTAKSNQKKFYVDNNAINKEFGADRFNKVYK
jgi:hypothetical protein